MQRNNHRPVAKRLRQQQLPQGSSVDNDKRQRFWPCPVCNRSFADFRLEDHVNQCLDSPSCTESSSYTSGTASPSPLQSRVAILPASSSPSSAPASRPCPPLLRRQDVPASVTGDVPCVTSVATAHWQLPVSACSVKAGKLPATETKEVKIPDSNSCRLLSGSTPAWVDEILHCSDRQGPVSARHQDGSYRPTERCLFLEDSGLQPFRETVVDKERGFPFVEEDEDEKAQLRCDSEFLGNKSCDSGSTDFWAEIPRTGDAKDGGIEEKRIVEGMIDGNVRPMDRPPAGFKLFQRQVQSQARLSMFQKFSPSAPLQRKPIVTVLQPGMVLFRSCLDLETQQKLVLESQDAAHLFRRFTTPGGGKYHVYSMCWGPKWEAKAHRYVSKGSEQMLPPWLFELSQKLAREAQHQTSVYPSDCIFAPDVGLVNFYPVKADELGVIGLGGHQDLDDSTAMPVVSVSVGDSMTFFYRRLPPLSRRKSGISISVDKDAARSCEDGDAAHNREQQIVLESGDVLVFGGQSRLVYHGTRHVQPGTRPPGLHMVPGRLNFTFRQTTSKSV